MVRSRWMSFVLAAGLLTSCGCCCFAWPEQGTILGQPPGTHGTEPQMAPMPRLAPIPAQPAPYIPMKRTSFEREGSTAATDSR
jgi:hypothetical protein